jgi:DNA helicase II / ATP-dependent DNA helicase PcrA
MKLPGVRPMTPTEEQIAIIDAAVSSPHNLQIRAYAGCGKTSTLERIDLALGEAPRLCLAFNKRIAQEMSGRLLPTTECRTLNSLGHRIWAKTITSRIVINPRKTMELFRAYVADHPKAMANHLWSNYDAIKTAVDYAKAVGYIPQGATWWEKRLTEDFTSNLEEPLPDSACRDAVESILGESIRLAYAGNLDFNDQLYMPALFGGAFPKFPLIMVDEVQDLSPINHAMVRKLVGSDRRLIAVGDEFQSIYGFRGADTGGMAKQRTAFNMSSLGLSISFRCPEAIVANARWRAPDFKAIRPGGTVEALQGLDLTTIFDGSAFICRNNMPLFRLAILLLTAGRSVSMAGTDIGPRLIGILKRFGDESQPRAVVLDKIDEWEAGRDSPTAKDLAECLRLFAFMAPTLGGAIAHAEYVLWQTGAIHLTTGHKAKGLEWPRVYHLDPWLIRSGEQEENLRYVIQTRSSDYHATISLEDIK